MLVLEAGVNWEELVNKVLLQSTVEAFSGIGIVFDIERFSNLERLLRVTAFILTFLSNSKKSVKKTESMYVELAVEELLAAEKLSVKNEQSVISTDYMKFEKSKNSLNLLYDNEKFVRLKIRMDKHLKFVFHNKNSLLLENNSYFTKLIILRLHKKVFQSGLEGTLSNVRIKYWIRKGRKTTKTVLKNCFVCNLV